MLMQKAKSAKFWEKVKSDPAYESVTAQIRDYYEQNRFSDIPALSYKARMRYYADGDRHEFERPYFRRRTCYSALALMALIYPEKEEYLEELQELIWAICEEYSWVVPAHCSNDLEDGLKHIDLFAAETAFMLAESTYLLEDRLDQLIKDRVKDEIRKRILTNYQNGSFWWETTTCNWAAVCAGNVGGALMYLFPEEFKELLPRFLSTMQCLLDGFPEDGTCLEGISYWHYGFGNYVWFADLLKQFTDGQIDLMKKDKVEQIAGYAQRSFLKGNVTVSFADGDMQAKVNVLMLNYLAELFPESVHPLPDEVSAFQKMNVMWMTYFRSVYYLELCRQPGRLSKEDVYLPQAGQAIWNREQFSLAVKAGDNSEPHNHNDVGNFILTTKNGQIFCDLGAGRYTRQYFAPETRYSIFCNGSQGHSVPIIDGHFQKEGKEYCGTIQQEENRIMAEFSGAYEAGLIQRLTRTFEHIGEVLFMADVFSKEVQNVTERFVTLKKVQLFADYVQVEDVKLYFDPLIMQAEITQAAHENHDLSISMVNCIDFILKTGVTKAVFRFTFE